MSFRDIQDPKSEQKYTAICPLFKQWIERTGGQDVTANGVRTISIQTSNKVIKELEESVPDDLFSECSKIIFKRLKPNHTGAIAAKVSAEESKDASPLNRPDINQQQHPSNANKPMAPAQSTSISEHELKRYSQMEECEQAYAKLKKDHALIEKKAAKELEEATRIRARLIEEFTRARDASLEKIKNNIDIMAKNN
jgi:hypothetical protein